MKTAVGPWNFSEVSPKQVMGRFSGFLRSVILRVSEIRDLGDVDRYAFYDAMKAYTAAPPDVLRVDEKYLREYSVFNVCGVIFTSNHKADGIYLPPDDRRHYVAWTTLTRDTFEADYWATLWRWYENGGLRHVAAYLATLDISAFDPKAPPPKTAAFWDIAAASSAPERGRRDGRRARQPRQSPSGDFAKTSLPMPGRPRSREWLGDRKNSRKIPHRLEACGYTPIRNRHTKDGHWVIGGRRQVIYAKSDISERDRLAAAASAYGVAQWWNRRNR